MDSYNGKVAIVFGISGEQGQHVAHGLLADSSYNAVYGVTHSIEENIDNIKRYLEDVEVITNYPAGSNGGTNRCLFLIEGELSDPNSIRSIFKTARASSIDIFLVTTTDLPPENSTDTSLHDCEEREFQTIKTFFDVLKEVHQERVSSNITIERHVVFSTLENVRGLVEWLNAHKVDDELANMKPLDDGGIVPHYTSKGRGGEYALKLLHGLPSPWDTQDPESLYYNRHEKTSSIIPGLSLTLITLPFLHSNFTASATPLATASEQRTQWSIQACLGDGSSRTIDMLSVSDLQYIVPVIFKNRTKYQGRNIRLSAEKISLDQVAYEFADLFGKDVVYAPLTPGEMIEIDPQSEIFAQMCQYLASPWGNQGDLDITNEIMGIAKRKPQTFVDWLLTHSDDEAFRRVGLTDDVFNATCMEGKSVIMGLLADKRKEYIIRACICNTEEEPETQAQTLLSLNRDRISIHYTNTDDIGTYVKAASGAEGAFVVSDFYNKNLDQVSNDDDLKKEEEEEKHAQNIIDACAQSGSVRHIVFSTLESAEDIDKELKNEDRWVTVDGDATHSGRKMFDEKMRLAAYARSKSLSVTFVLMPVYSEDFFRAPTIKTSEDDTADTDYNMSNDKSESKFVCMSVDDLGSAVANIFDSYEVFAGHEIALMADVLSLKEAFGMIKEVCLETNAAAVKMSDGALGPKKTVAIHTPSWTQTEGDPNEECKCLSIFAKDLGSMFSFMNKSQVVKRRHNAAKTMELVPDVRAFHEWVRDNRENVQFRAMLGIR